MTPGRKNLHPGRKPEAPPEGESKAKKLIFVKPASRKENRKEQKRIPEGKTRIPEGKSPEAPPEGEPEGLIKLILGHKQK